MTTRLEEIERRVNERAPCSVTDTDGFYEWSVQRTSDFNYLLALARSLSEEVKALRDALGTAADPYTGQGCKEQDEALAKADAIAKQREEGLG